jgi:hypothetical protein
MLCYIKKFQYSGEHESSIRLAEITALSLFKLEAVDLFLSR